MLGPVLAFLFWQARLGPSGMLWWQWKGGETILTPLGRTISIVLLMGGAFVGALCGNAMDVRNRPSKWKGR